jgi:ABC-type nitrate/sulfonate/bicarbonate transport system substrate-binding protein
MRILGVIGLLLAVLSAASLRTQPAAAAGKFVVGYAAMNARLAPLWLAEEQVFFNKYGMESQAVFLRSATMLVTGLSSRDIHVGTGGGSAALAAASAGHDVKILGSFPFATPMTSWRGLQLNGLKICAARRSASPVSAAVLGWARCSGSNNSASIRSAIKSPCSPSAIKPSRVRPWKAAPWTRRRLTVSSAGDCARKASRSWENTATLKKPMINQSAMVSNALLRQRPEIAENFLKAMIESIAFSFAPKNKPIVVKTIMRRLKAEQNSAEEGYDDLLRAIEK